MVHTLVYDTEVFRDYFLLAFKSAETGKEKHFEMFEGYALDVEPIRKILRTHRVVGFNSIKFDQPIVTRALQGASCSELKDLANRIIEQNLWPWELGFDPVRLKHIDLIEVAPGVMTSLKVYGGRLHSQKIQDLPFDPDALIAPEDRPMVRSYCSNDLQTTLDLYNKLQPQLALRERMSVEHGIDLCSKSDAQIAEAVIRTKVQAIQGWVEKAPSQVGKNFRYRAPAFIHFQSEQLARTRAIVDTATFYVNGKGVVEMPPEVEALSIAIGGSVYRMGIGGLHSSEQSVSWREDDEHILQDVDVVSYYPAIILNCELAPAQMAAHFGRIYRGILTERVRAKKQIVELSDKIKTAINPELSDLKDKLIKAQTMSEGGKIQLNGSFGKFGSPYSRLYSPRLLIQTTITGQLALLMLIEQLEAEGIPVVSANTDGVVIRCPRSKIDLMGEVVAYWNLITGFETEANRYRALHSRDVNNYIAIKNDGKVKLKGAYAPAGLMKNPANEICVEAAVRHLTDGTPVEDVIFWCEDIRKFLTIRTVTGGGVDQDGAYLGKVVRWYYARDRQGALTYRTNGNQVARSEGARAIMELPERFPDDVDMQWYVREARAILKDVGA